MSNHRATIVVGRFQPPHLAHIGLIKKALELGDQTIILLGSAFHARTIKNCFTHEEVEQMIRLCLTSEENSRAKFVPIRDYNDNGEWYRVAYRKVHLEIPDIPDHDIRVVGHFKDASSEYLAQMPWETLDTGSNMKIDATLLRKMLFETDDVDVALTAMQPYVSHKVISFLKVWSVLPHLRDMQAEYAKIKKEQKEYGGEYGLTADMILQFDVEDDDSYVLLVERGRWPGKSLLAVPGGFYDPSKNETLFQCCLRECLEETQHNIWEPQLRKAFVSREFFDAPGRSVRKNIFTMAHHFHMKGRELPLVKESIEPGEAISKFYKVRNLAGMEDRFFDDHFGMLHKFLKFPIED